MERREKGVTRVRIREHLLISVARAERSSIS